ncbi:TPA: hypothetical protein ACH3X1_004453 [Trebouxia sp. C0004]
MQVEFQAWNDVFPTRHCGCLYREQYLIIQCTYAAEHSNVAKFSMPNSFTTPDIVTAVLCHLYHSDRETILQAEPLQAPLQHKHVSEHLSASDYTPKLHEAANTMLDQQIEQDSDGRK